MSGQGRPLRAGERVFAVVMLLLSLALLWQAVAISGFEALSSPGAFPMAAAAAMLAGAVTVLAKAIRAPRDPDSAAKGFLGDIAPGPIIVFAGFALVFAILLETLGFLPSALLFLFAAIWFLMRRGPAFALMTALGSLIVVYVVFRLVFQVVLPEGVVPEREIMAAIGHLISGAAK